MRLDGLSLRPNNLTMPKRSSKRPKRPTDTNQLAKAVVDLAVNGPSGDQMDREYDSTEGKNPAAVALGRLGGLKGGKARAKKLSKKRKSDIARTAAKARWASHRR